MAPLLIPLGFSWENSSSSSNDNLQNSLEFRRTPRSGKSPTLVGSFLATPHLGAICGMCDHLGYNNIVGQETLTFIWLSSPKLRNALVPKPGISLYFKHGSLRTILFHCANFWYSLHLLVRLPVPSLRAHCD